MKVLGLWEFAKFRERERKTERDRGDRQTDRQTETDRERIRENPLKLNILPYSKNPKNLCPAFHIYLSLGF